MVEPSRNQSTKRTNESSPAIDRWDRGRVSFLSPHSGRLSLLSRLCRQVVLRISVVRDADSRALPECHPSTEVLGYYQPSALRTLRAALRVFLIMVSLGGFSVSFSQTAPAVLKVEPPG